MYKIAICDDNKYFLKEMEELIRSNKEYTDSMTVECFEDGNALMAEDIKSFTMIVMDMCLNEADGYSVAKQIREKNEDVVIAFCSGVVTPQREHFKVQPYRYIDKQADMSNTSNDLADCLYYMKQKYEKNIVQITNDGKTRIIKKSDIIYIYPIKRGSILKIATKKNGIEEICSNQLIRDWYSELKDYGFEFPNKSNLINIMRISTIDKRIIVMDDNTEIDLTRAYKAQFIERFAMYYDKKFKRVFNK